MKLGALPTDTLDPATDTVLVVRDVAGVKSDIRVPATDFSVPVTPGTPIPALHPGAGTGATVTLINCTDKSGTIQVTTGTSPSTSQRIVEMAFSTAYTTPVSVVFSPFDENANTASGFVYCNSNHTAGFSIVANSLGSLNGPGVVYEWSYIVL